MTVLLTPYDSGTARRAGRHLWRKQILPLGTIDYKGRTITFDRDYLAGIAAAFDAAAFDQVPFQLADAANAHTNDPERFRGEVEAFELTDDGLDVIVSATGDGSAVLAANPRLGISARIVEDYQRADGRSFPAAIQHVLGTLDPRITGMRPWQAIDAAAGSGDDIDLTGLAYAPLRAPQPAHQEETGMSLTAEQEQRLGQLLDLPEDRFAAILSGPPEDAAGLTDEELQALLDSLPEEAAEGGKAAAEKPQPAEPAPAEPEAAAPAKEPQGAAVPAPRPPAEMAVPPEAQAAIDLANARAAEQEIALARMQAQLDATSYEKERDAYARKHGIPPRIFDLARPLLEGAGRVIELSGGKTADAGAIVRQVLREIGQTARLLDLSAETGDPAGADADTAREQQSAAERDGVIRSFRAMTGV